MKTRLSVVVVFALSVVSAGLIARGQTPASDDEIRGDNTLRYIWKHGENAPQDSVVREQYRDQYLKASAVFLAHFPNHPDIWMFRAMAALELDRPQEGREAGEKGIALGLDRSDALGMRKVFAALRARGWLTSAGSVPGIVPGGPATAPQPAPPPAAPPPAPAPLAGHAIDGGAAGIALQWLAAGTFQMGDKRYGPITTVHLTHGYWLGKYPVTQGQWEALMNDDPSRFPSAGKTAPIDNVSWLDCAVFLRRLNVRESAAGRVPAGYEYRLPTEAEWEYGCRAGTAGDFGADDMIGQVAWFADNSEAHPHPVGLKEPNAWGLYDMHGNVWEWCRDWFGKYPGGEVTDPVGPATGVLRINRGGSWQNASGNCTAGQRHSGAPDYRHRTNGLRVALAPVIAP